MHRLERVWEAAATLLWVLPLLAFLALHGRNPPPPPAQAVVALLVLLGLLAPRALGPRYFRVRCWEVRGAVYRALGVRRFGRWVPRGAVMNRVARRAGSAGPRAQLPRSRVADAAARQALAAATRESERTHWWWLMMTAAVTFWAAAIAAWPAVTMLMLVNVLLNGYPLMLQRDTRARLHRLDQRYAGATGHPGRRVWRTR